ncbi:MAG: hypothetical protein ACX939_13210, partial [Hyphococcus sp.]
MSPIASILENFDEDKGAAADNGDDIRIQQARAAAYAEGLAAGEAAAAARQEAEQRFLDETAAQIERAL